MSEKVCKAGIKREDGYLYFVDKEGDISRVKRGESKKEKVFKCDHKKEHGWMYYVDKDGDVSRSKMKAFREFYDLKESKRT